MDAFEDSRRQLRAAFIAMAIILPAATIGFVLIEGMSLLDAIWLTVITLATIGYGDIYARTELGRAFTILLVFSGLGTFAYAVQAAVAFFVSPGMRTIRQRRKALFKISRLRGHYILCGEGELVNNIIAFMLQRAALRRNNIIKMRITLIERRMERLLGPSQRVRGLRNAATRTALALTRFTSRSMTLLDQIVIVTKEPGYASRLRENGLLVVEADPTDEEALLNAGIEHAIALMVILESDTDSLMSVLTARSKNNEVYITAAIQDEEIRAKIVRVGANNVLAPFEAAGQFLTNATLRPVVNDFFNSVIYEQAGGIMLQIRLNEQSPWIGRSLEQLTLRERFGATVIAVRQDDSSYIYAPEESHIPQEGDVILVIAPMETTLLVQQDAQHEQVWTQGVLNWQRLPPPAYAPPVNKQHSLLESEIAVKDLSQHYIICGTGTVLRTVTEKLSPERPFVILSNDPQFVSDMLKRGFRVIHGDPTHDATLRKAGLQRALALMVSMSSDADTVVTVLNARTMSKSLLITATANNDAMIAKLQRAGADRVVSPYRVAAQFVLLATTRPVVHDFMQYVLYNRQTGLETTELYMQENSPWVGKSLHALDLRSRYQAGVLGIRRAEGVFVFAPSSTHVIQPHEVLVVVTPIDVSDALRTDAHGGESRRPRSIRLEDSQKIGVRV